MFAGKNISVAAIRGKKDTVEISSMHCGKSWLPGKLVVRENYEGKQ